MRGVCSSKWTPCFSNFGFIAYSTYFIRTYSAISKYHNIVLYTWQKEDSKLFAASSVSSLNMTSCFLLLLLGDDCDDACCDADADEKTGSTLSINFTNSINLDTLFLVKPWLWLWASSSSLLGTVRGKMIWSILSHSWCCCNTWWILAYDDDLVAIRWISLLLCLSLGLEDCFVLEDDGKKIIVASSSASSWAHTWLSSCNNTLFWCSAFISPSFPSSFFRS